LCFKPKKSKGKRYDHRGFNGFGIHRNGTKYDEQGYDYNGYDRDGYNRHGYNHVGKTRLGHYNRFYDTTSSEEEGFLPLNTHPIALTNHARERLQERLGVSNEREMLKLATDAYRYGKSKRQIKKTSAWMIYEIEQRHENGILLIYKNYIYVFSNNNVLITVYQNEKIPL
jgi:hypothetical protein